MVLDDSAIAFFLVRTPNWKKFRIEVRTAAVRSPFYLSPPKGIYETYGRTLVYFDRENGKWFMYFYDRYPLSKG